jgi:glycosyltransferase involved in cell wall biosynthesis
MRPQRPDLCLLCPFDLGRLSGSPLRARATLEALDQASLDIRVLATTDAEGARALPGVLRRGRLSIPRFCAVAFRALLELRPLVVHCFTPLAALPAIAARRLAGSRVVVEVHGSAEYELAHARPHVRAFFSMLDRHVIRHADAVLAMGASHEAFLRHRCGVDAPIRVSWGPIDVSRRPFLPPEPQSPRRFGYFGNAHFWQGLEDLAAAAALCPPDSVTVSVAGVDAVELPEQARRILRARGHLDREAMLDEMSKCDVLVSPRRGGRVTDLQYPFKLSAYLASGRAVVGTDVGDQGEIIRRARCGIVVPPESPSKLAHAMMEIAGMSDDAVGALGRRARRFAEDHLGYDRLREQLRDLYRLPLP